MACPIGANELADASSFSGKAGGAGIQIPGAQIESLRCGWTDSPANRVSCLSNIPKDVVTAAWRRELAWDGVRADLAQGRP